MSPLNCHNYVMVVINYTVEFIELQPILIDRMENNFATVEFAVPGNYFQYADF